jgi:hypothetical protein
MWDVVSSALLGLFRSWRGFFINSCPEISPPYWRANRNPALDELSAAMNPSEFIILRLGKIKAAKNGKQDEPRQIYLH